MKCKKYKCIVGFAIECMDGDGLLDEGKYFTIEDDTVWTLNEDAVSLSGAELVLDRDGELGFIEISHKTLEEHFEEYEEVE